jgi:signal transduction histidine kinase
VPAAVRERLFHPVATGRPDGVGLGLALTHRIATLHGGTVRLEDRAGGGTRAVLALPAGNPVTEGNDLEARPVLAAGRPRQV